MLIWMRRHIDTTAIRFVHPVIATEGSSLMT
jgi:hypothetical protein